MYKHLIIALFVLTFMGCKYYKKTCNEFIKPKVELLAENIAIKCQCNSSKVQSLFKHIPNKICIKGKDKINNILEESDRDGGALSMLACNLVTEVIINFTGQYASNKLECKIALDKCLSNGFLLDIINKNVCSYL